jgi:nucleotide-binding universal stress UspA family protein
VAVEVLEESPVPLLMTGPQAVDPTAETPVYRLALATDGGYESYSRLGKLRETMELPNIEPLLVGISVPVLHEPDNALDELTKHCKQVAKTISPKRAMEVVTSRATGFEKLEAAIVRVATEASADAIGMVSASTSRRRHIFMGSVSLATLNRSPLPIILMRADD